MQDWFNSEKTTAIATAITAVAVIGIPFLAEYRNRLYSIRQIHHQQIKKDVLTYLRDLVVDFYIPTLSRKWGVLVRTSHLISNKELFPNPVSQNYQYDLKMKEPRLALSRALAPEDHSEEWTRTFRQLYEDTKSNHLFDFFVKWESFIGHFQALSDDSRARVVSLSQKLEKELQLPALVNPSGQQVWIDYYSFALVIYDCIWCLHPNSFQVLQENNWVLKYMGNTVGQGSKEQIENCRTVAEKLYVSEHKTFDTLFPQAKSLAGEAELLKQELQELLEANRLYGSCPYIKAQFF